MGNGSFRGPTPERCGEQDKVSMSWRALPMAAGPQLCRRTGGARGGRGPEALLGPLAGTHSASGCSASARAGWALGVSVGLAMVGWRGYLSMVHGPLSPPLQPFPHGEEGDELMATMGDLTC